MIKRKNSEELLGQNEDEDEDLDRNVPYDEVRLINHFLEKFKFTSEQSSQSIIDIGLALNALPEKIDEKNLYRIELLGFKIIQDSLVAYQNDEQDELFRYYDMR